MKTATAVLIDGYVDEPACLGVPPYLSPYIRTVSGVLLSHGYQVRYLTIDQLRKDPLLLPGLRGADIVVMIAGVTVPGKYLSGTPATLLEIRQIGAQLRGETTLLAGPIGFGYAPEGGQKAVKEAVSGFDQLLTGSPPAAVDAFLRSGKTHGEFDYGKEDRWAVAGSGILASHPNFPYVMCEIETARGCSRGITGGCSFCTEPLYGPPRYRSVEGVAREVAALYKAGARYFRLGRQPDILTYGAASGQEFPVPRPDRVEALFRAVRDAAPDLRCLHIDNVNPGTIARHPEESRQALRAIVSYHTPGDVAAFGMETADPAVVSANNLKASPEEVMNAIAVVNEAGGCRSDGIPHLLPGLNFVIGLAGETPRTFKMNLQFLADVASAGYLVRRVNIRQLMPFSGTRAYTDNTLKRHQAEFRDFKEQVRRTFDLPMLRRVFPVGTLLRDVIVEQQGNPSFGRQMGSYPILVGFPILLKAGTVVDAAVVDYGMRSLSALPVPVEINRIPPGALAWIPGIGKKRSGLLAARRPFRNLDEFRAAAGDTPLDSYLSF
jgi:radical SAM superfamily enzyme with C-terminal helix-hairpin-helix motif